MLYFNLQLSKLTLLIFQIYVITTDLEELEELPLQSEDSPFI